MRLLIADKLHPRAIEELRSLPVEVEYDPELTSETLETRLRGVGILIVRSTPVTAAAIDAAPALHLIVRAGTDVQSIDIRAASRRGVFVAHVPGRNAAAVAELVFGLMINLDRRLPDALGSLRSGRWERAEYGRAEGLHGKTLGIAGLGAVGREVAHRARAFGLNVLAWGRSLTPIRAGELGVGVAATLEELASKSDILSVHLPLTDKTQRCINKTILELLPPRAMFINAARADLVDYEALRACVEQRGLRVGLDVYPGEPRGTSVFSAELFKPVQGKGLIYGTPHIASSTDQAQLSVAVAAVKIIRSFLLEGNIPNTVNVPHTSAARFQLVIRMLDRVGTFANVLGVLKRHDINVEEVTNAVFEGGNASHAKLRLLSRPSEACMAEIRAFEEVLYIDVIPLPNLA